MARRREFDEATVVNQAMDLFWQQGYRSTTPAALAEATGLSKSSLYATFASKEGLFLASLERYVESQVTQMRSVLSEGSLREGLERLYAGLLNMGASGRTCLVCTSSIEAPVDSAPVADAVAKGHAALEAVFYERLVRAREEGEIDPERDPRVLAQFIVNNNMGLMVLARAKRDPEGLRAIAAEVVRAVCGSRSPSIN